MSQLSKEELAAIADKSKELDGIGLYWVSQPALFDMVGKIPALLAHIAGLEAERDEFRSIVEGYHESGYIDNGTHAKALAALKAVQGQG